MELGHFGSDHKSAIALVGVALEIVLVVVLGRPVIGPHHHLGDHRLTKSLALVQMRHPFLGEDCDDANDVDDDECANDCTGDITGFGSCADVDLGSATGASLRSGTTVGAGNDFEATCASSSRADDLTFNWIAPTSGAFDINTEGSSYDTSLHIRGFPEEVLTDECVDSVELFCNDDSVFGLRSQIILNAEAGVEYLIIVDGFGTSSGNYVLNILEP